MGAYSYISVLALFCYCVMFLTFMIAKKDRLVNSFLLILAGMILWTGGSVMMRIRFYPDYKFWYHISLAGILLIPFAYYRFINIYIGLQERMTGRIYLLVSTVCFLINVKSGLILQCPAFGDGQGARNFVYHADWKVLLFILPVTGVLIDIYYHLARVWKVQPWLWRRFVPVFMGLTILFAGNAAIGLPCFASFPIDILSGLLNAFCLFYALMCRNLFSLQMLDLVDNLFEKNEFRKAKSLREFSSSVSKTLRMKDVVEETIRVIKESLPVEHVWICMKKKDGRIFDVFYGDTKLKKPDVYLSTQGDVAKYLTETDTPLSCREFYSRKKNDDQGEGAGLKRAGVECCVGLRDNEELAGVILLTSKEGKFRMGYNDIEFLSSLSSVASIAVKNARLYEQAYWEARTDDMTYLLNRKYFFEVLNREFEKNKKGCLTLSMLNLDDFKLYNQLYGVREGDRCICRIADILRESVGRKGYAARYSGKEFAILLPGYSAAETKELVESVCGRIFRMNQKPGGVDKERMKSITVSAGISVLPGSARNVNEFLEAADMAVYHVKHNGKNGIRIFDEKIQNSREKRGEGKEKHAHIYQEYESTIYALTAAIDAKDHYTFSHCNNVAYYATSLARYAGMNEDVVEIVRQSALLHDVGKIGIPETVLNKKGRLTDEEYEIIKGHVEASTGIIRHLPSLDYVIPAVIGHHERYDGKGYPRRIAGEDIPVTARILCIADSFDAMTSKRCYKKAIPMERAREILLEEAGAQFDSWLARAFVECLDKGIIKIVDSEFSGRTAVEA